MFAECPSKRNLSFVWKKNCDPKENKICLYQYRNFIIRISFNYHSETVIILEFWTPKSNAVIYLKINQNDFSIVRYAKDVNHDQVAFALCLHPLHMPVCPRTKHSCGRCLSFQNMLNEKKKNLLTSCYLFPYFIFF